MSQEYTPVEWQDETTSQQGTLINAARLDQMQTAHHYADGFEEVDAAPTANPGVSYHKVVFCTADTTFYRWTGTEWVKDIDDTTAAALAAHEADHSNPHAVTKAQVGLGNCDNTSDLNKPVSTAQQAALDLKADKTQLADGSVTKVGTATVGDYNQPIYLDAGVPKAGYKPVYSVNGQDGPVATLNGKNIPWTDTQSAPSIEDEFGTLLGYITDLQDSAVLRDENGDIIGNIGAVEIVGAATITGADLTVAEDNGTGGGITAKTITATAGITGSLTGPATKLGTVDVGTDTKPIKLVAGVPTAVSNDLVDTATAQTIGGVKTYTASAAYYESNTDQVMWYRNNTLVAGTNPSVDTFIYTLAARQGTKLVSRVATISKPDGDVVNRVQALAHGSTESGTLDVHSIGYVTIPNRAYNASNTSDAVNIALLDAYTPMVRTSGNQTIAGVKTLSSSMIQSGSACPTMRPGNDPRGTTPATTLSHNMVLVQDDLGNNLAGLFSTTGTDGLRHITAYVFDCDGTYRSQVIL